MFALMDSFQVLSKKFPKDISPRGRVKLEEELFVAFDD